MNVKIEFYVYEKRFFLKSVKAGVEVLFRNIDKSWGDKSIQLKLCEAEIFTTGNTSL